MARQAAGRVAGWPAAALLAVAFAIAMIGTTLPTPLYPIYQQAFGFGELLTTIVFATYAIGVVAALLLMGSWSDHLGRRPMLRAGLVLAAASAIVFVLADSTAWLFPGRVLSGLSAGIFTGTATAALVDVAPRGRKARAGLIAAGVNMGGLGLGPVLAGVLAQYAPGPLRLPYLVHLGLVVVAAIAVECVAEPVGRAHRPRLRPQRLAVPAEVRPVFVRAAIAGFAGFAVLGLFTAVSPAFLDSVLHNTNRAVVGALVLAVFAASTAGQVASARIGDRPALLAGCAGLIAGMLLVGSSLPTASLPLLVTGAIVAGLGQGMGFRAGLTSVTVTVAGPADRRGEIISTYFVVLYIGIAIPVIGEGAAASAFGLVPAGMAFAAGVAVLAAIALALLTRRG
ncbi:MFS transporter [Amycolatopsis taiwanensis]|uniref:MFS transporter n=1 Tax=Amycolatopsis taiwanensis TaxID=342230 RepID=UPI002555E397|nr:MFS transporter [Amycolatopsis taiwanensis]